MQISGIVNCYTFRRIRNAVEFIALIESADLVSNNNADAVCDV
jgi:hypothetical protein